MSGSWQVPAHMRRAFDIRIAEPMLDDAYPVLVAGGDVPGRRFIVFDSGVPAVWRDRLRDHCAGHGVRTRHLVVSASGRGCTTRNVTSIVDALREFGLDRRSEPIVVVGGRAVLDVVSFVAGIYRRGVPFVRAPSTPAGYLEASLRAWASADMADVAELVNVSVSPQRIVLDRQFFDTLPPRVLARGLVNLMRIGLAADRGLFELLEARADRLRTSRLRDQHGLAVLRRATDTVLDIQRPDVFERWMSPAREFGRGFARAFQQSGGDTVQPGDAMAWSVNLCALIAARRGLLDESSLDRIGGLTGRLGLVAAVPDIDPSVLLSALPRPRAARSGVPVPLLCGIGECHLVDDLSVDEVAAALGVLRGGHVGGDTGHGHPRPAARRPSPTGTDDLPVVPRPGGRQDPHWHVPVHEDVTYSIEVVEPLTDPANTTLLDSGNESGHRVIAWDCGVPGHQRDAFAEYFAAHGVPVSFVPINGGESCKTLDTALALVRALHEHHRGRAREPLIVVGGGAVLDVAGFAASIYRGGLPVIRIPTTLLAYVDASIGIKTGINFRDSKNLLGTFTPPGRVLLDCGFFDSLPEVEWTSGIGEILKLGLGCDKVIFEMLEQGADVFQPRHVGATADGRALLYRSIDVMLAELVGNIYETDLARTVDLGHTFSQAFEMGRSSMRHGHAVGIDLLMCAVIAVQRGMMSRGDLDRLVALMRGYGMPLAPGYPDFAATWRSLLERMQHRNTKQRTPIPWGIGRCEFVNDLTAPEVSAAFRWIVALAREPTVLGERST